MMDTTSLTDSKPESSDCPKTNDTVGIQALNNITFPELVFGIVAPVGVDTKRVVELLNRSLSKVGYTSRHIKITDLMKHIPTSIALEDKPLEKRYDTRIRYANEVRRLFENNGDKTTGNDALASLAIAGIREARKTLTTNFEMPANKHAYILDQFKRPEEIQLIRRIYGRLFIQVSVHSTRKIRKDVLQRGIRDSHTDLRLVETSAEAEHLIYRDAHEEKEDHGQRVIETFHLADIIINGNNKDSAERDVDRSIRLFFGHNFITPTHDEYGMYMAKAAALRSADLSRQVGAAIFSTEGEVITLGSNEVPKAGGGTYFEGDKPDHRDYAEGSDFNELEKRKIALEILEKLHDAGCLCIPPSSGCGESKEEKFAFLLEADKGPKIKDSRVMDILEFGRQIHAEMSALVDAARLGRSVKGATLYCTTFPCHMCTKLIIGAGIKRVVYLEPYPKSYVEEMYTDTVALEAATNPHEPQIVFEPFTGIAPFRYRDFFEKGRRKGRDGNINEWKVEPPRPNVNFLYPTYLHLEQIVVANLATKISTISTVQSLPKS
jgi:deoxycytidylate deaminase